MTVPRALVITEQDARLSPIGQLFVQDPVVQSIPSLLLALYLLFEKLRGTQSDFQPYINVLPSAFQIPTYWSANDFGRLKGTPAYNESVKLISNLARQYCHIFGVLSDYEVVMAKQDAKAQLPIRPSELTWAAFKWATGAVMTRQNEMPWEAYANDPATSKSSMLCL